MELDNDQGNYIIVDDGTEYKEDTEIDNEEVLIEIKQEESLFERAFHEMRQSLMENYDIEKKETKEEEQKRKKKEQLEKQWEIIENVK